MVGRLAVVARFDGLGWACERSPQGNGVQDFEKDVKYRNADGGLRGSISIALGGLAKWTTYIDAEVEQVE